MLRNWKENEDQEKQGMYMHKQMDFSGRKLFTMLARNNAKIKVATNT